MAPGHRPQMPVDTHHVGHLGGRQQGDVGLDRVCRGIAEALAPTLELIGERPGDGNGHPDGALHAPLARNPIAA